MSAVAVTHPPPLGVLAGACFFSMAAMRACDSLLPQLARDFNTTTGAAAWTVAGFAIAYGLMQLVYGPMGDRHGKPRVMLLAVLACAVANGATALAQGLDAAVALRMLAGAAGGGIVPLSIAAIGDGVQDDKRQETLARLSMATIAGMITGQWLGGVLAELWGWRSVFVVLSLGFVAVSLPVRRWARSSEAPGAGARAAGSYLQQTLAVWHAPWPRTVLLCTFAEGLFAMAPFTFIASHLHQAFGLSLGQSGAVMALYGLGGLCFGLLSRPLIRRLGEPGLVAQGGGLLALSLAMMAWAPQWWWVALPCFLSGMGLYMLHSTFQTKATQMMPALRGTAVSMFVVCLFGGQAVGVALGALLVDHASARVVFMVCAGATLLLVFYFRRRLLQQAAAADQATT